MSKFCIFDVETTGLPVKNRDKKYYPLNETRFYPFTVQFSWMIYDNKLKKIEKICNYIIKLPDGEIIPNSSIKIHGVTNERMMKEGKDIKEILKEFNSDLLMCDTIVAHNLDFDKRIIQVECIRNKINDNLEKNELREYCTLQNSINVCKIVVSGRYGPYYKWPKLIELHEHLYGTVPNNLHNSLVDIYVCFRCFHQLYYEKDIMDNNEELVQHYNQLCGF